MHLILAAEEVISGGCWGSLVMQDFGADVSGSCEWILILEASVYWVYFIVKVWKSAMFLVQFLLLV